MFSLPAWPNSGQYSTTGAFDVEATLLRQLVRADGRRALRRGEDDDHRVLDPRCPGGFVGDAAPEVHDLLAAVVRRERRADVESVGEVLLEPVAHAFEARRRPTVNRHADFLPHERFFRHPYVLATPFLAGAPRLSCIRFEQ